MCESPLPRQVPPVLVEILPVSNASVSLSFVCPVVPVLCAPLFLHPYINKYPYIVISKGTGGGEEAVKQKVSVRHLITIFLSHRTWLLIYLVPWAPLVFF